MLSRRSAGSHLEAKGAEPTALAERAILFYSPERGGSVSGGMGHGAAESSRDSSANQCWFLQSGATNRTLCFCFPDLTDYLWDQGDRGKSIKEEVGPVVGQRILVLRKISWAMRVVS